MTEQEMESKKALHKRLARLRAQKRKLEASLEPLRSAHGREREQRIGATLPELRARLFRAVSYQQAVNIAARGGSQLDLPRYGADTLGDFTSWLVTNRECVGWPGETPTSGQLERNPLRYIGSLLERFDLRQKRVGKNHARTYALDLGALRRVPGAAA